MSINYASIGGAEIALHTSRLGGAVIANHVHYYDMVHTGVLVDDGEPQIIASLFSPGLGANAGIRAIFSGEPAIANNVIAGFQLGIDLNQSVPTTTYISNNTIYGAEIGIHVAPDTGTSVNVFITNNIVTGFGRAGQRGIKVQGGPDVNVALSHNNVTAPVPYSGIAAGPGSLSVWPDYVSGSELSPVGIEPDDRRRHGDQRAGRGPSTINLRHSAALSTSAPTNSCAIRRTPNCQRGSRPDVQRQHRRHRERHTDRRSAAHLGSMLTYEWTRRRHLACDNGDVHAHLLDRRAPADVQGR